MATKTEIIQAAIARLGSEIPSSLGDDVDELAAINAFYESTANSLLCKHGWKFATRTATLVCSATENLPKPWCGRYDLPSENINVRAVYHCGDRFFNYDIIENKLYADTDADLDVEYNWRASEARWSPDACDALEERILAKALEAFDEYNKAELKHKRADKLEMMAIRRDRTQAPQKRVQNGRLLRAHYNRRPGRA